MSFVLANGADPETAFDASAPEPRTVLSAPKRHRSTPLSVYLAC